MLAAAEGDKAPVKVDAEGGVQATESNTRFIGTAVAVLVASAAGDNDPIRAPSVGGRRGAIIGQSQNVAGRTLGGGLGFSPARPAGSMTEGKFGKEVKDQVNTPDADY